MERDIQFKGFLKAYMNWPFYLGAFLVLSSTCLIMVDRRAGLAAVGISLVYLLVALILFRYYRKRFVQEMISFGTNYGQVQKQIMMDMLVPYALVDRSGHLLWMNSQFMEIAGCEKNYHKSLATVFPQAAQERFPDQDQVRQFQVKKNDREYRMQIKPIAVEEFFQESEVVDVKASMFSMYAVYLVDVTELNHYIRLNREERLVSGLVYIDNYEEVMESVDSVRRSLLAALIERRISKHFLDHDVVLRRMEKDRFFIVMKQKALEELKEKRFDILEEVKSVNIGNDMAVTLSIGIGMGGATLNQNSEYARTAIELALGRGGDQVVVKDADELNYYGGKSQHAEKNTRVKARVKAHALREIMLSKDRILIMGHKLSDVDSLGAAIGIYRAAKTLGKKAHIIINSPTAAVRPLIELFEKEKKEYGSDMFVNNHEARELIGRNAMLVVVDVNRPSYTEFEEILHLVDTKVVLDHHRQGSEVIQGASLSYIEPYASSACEMVAEILQYFDDSTRIRNIEADSLYAGIMVDTNNFLTKTGVRTFEAAAFLRRNGADITRIRKMFREKMENLTTKGEAIARAELYKGVFAISECPAPPNVESPTVVGAQAANELLNINGIKASFVLTLYKDDVHISARAIDEVNVQIIMERLGGGGHLNVAGAQIKNKTVNEVKELLKQTLDTMTAGGEI